MPIPTPVPVPDSGAVGDGTVVWTSTEPSYVTITSGVQALSFTGGSGQYVQLPTSPGPLDAPAGMPFTFECFFGLTGLPSFGTAILAQRDQTWLQGVTSAGDVTLTISGTSTALAAGVTLSVNTMYHVAAVYDGTNWYLCLAGSLVGTPTAAYDGGAVGPAAQSLAGDGTTTGTLPGILGQIRVSNFARYASSTYTVPTPPLPWDASTRVIYSLNGTPANTALLAIGSPGGGNAGTAYAGAVGLTGSVSGTVTVNLSDGFSSSHFSPSSVDLSNDNPTAQFTYTPNAAQAGTAVTITATPSVAAVSPAVAPIAVLSTTQLYTIAVTAPYGVTFSGLAAQLGYWIYDPSNPANALRWTPGTTGMTEQGAGTGVYMMLIKADPTWTRVLVWDAPAGVTPYVEALNPQRAAGA